MMNVLKYLRLKGLPQAVWSMWDHGGVLGSVDIAGFDATRHTEQDAMDILDILLLALVLWIAHELLNDDDFGGGKRSRLLNLWPASSS